MMRSRNFVVLLVLAVVVGVVISLAAWAFLEVIGRLQTGVFEDLPDAARLRRGAVVVAAAGPPRRRHRGRHRHRPPAGPGRPPPRRGLQGRTDRSRRPSGDPPRRHRDDRPRRRARPRVAARGARRRAERLARLAGQARRSAAAGDGPGRGGQLRRHLRHLRLADHRGGAADRGHRPRRADAAGGAAAGPARRRDRHLDVHRHLVVGRPGHERVLAGSPADARLHPSDRGRDRLDGRPGPRRGACSP